MAVLDEEFCEGYKNWLENYEGNDACMRRYIQFKRQSIAGKENVNKRWREQKDDNNNVTMRVIQ